MSSALLGEHFDIHGGGQDLQFPHHENEIAQSEGATGHPFVNYWMHNGFVRVDDEKMSKSLGNFFTIRDILRRYDPEVVRFFVARAHYRSPLNYSDLHLDDARQALTRLYTALKDAPPAPATPDWSEPHAQRLREAMEDDFGAPEAFAALFDLANEVNRTGSAALALQLRALGNVLGFLQRDAKEFLQSTPQSFAYPGSGGAAFGGAAPVIFVSAMPETEIDALIREREAARKNRDFKRADQIRADLLAKGVVLEDSPKGTTWRRG